MDRKHLDSKEGMIGFSYLTLDLINLFLHQQLPDGLKQYWLGQVYKDMGLILIEELQHQQLW
jgi:hypothetical protein